MTPTRYPPRHATTSRLERRANASLYIAAVIGVVVIIFTAFWDWS